MIFYQFLYQRDSLLCDETEKNCEWCKLFCVKYQKDGLCDNKCGIFEIVPMYEFQKDEFCYRSERTVDF